MSWLRHSVLNHLSPRKGLLAGRTLNRILPCIHIHIHIRNRFRWLFARRRRGWRDIWRSVRHRPGKVFRSASLSFSSLLRNPLSSILCYPLSSAIYALLSSIDSLFSAMPRPSRFSSSVELSHKARLSPDPTLPRIRIRIRFSCPCALWGRGRTGMAHHKGALTEDGCPNRPRTPSPEIL